MSWTILSVYLSFAPMIFLAYRTHIFFRLGRTVDYRVDGRRFVWLAGMWIGNLSLTLYLFALYWLIYLLSQRKMLKLKVVFKPSLLFASEAFIMLIFFKLTAWMSSYAGLLGTYGSILVTLHIVNVTSMIVYRRLHSGQQTFLGYKRKLIELTWMDTFTLSFLIDVRQALPIGQSEEWSQILTQIFLWLSAMGWIRFRRKSISQKLIHDSTLMKLNNTSEQLNVANEQILTAFARSLETRDAYTAGHSERVAKYGVLIASEMGFKLSDLRLIKLGGLLHDVGKIGIPDSILYKEGKLTESEYHIMKQHPQIGEKLLRGVYHYLSSISEDEKDLIYGIVLFHHERMDGRGYPYGLKERQIPVFARIMAVADAYDAMTSNRSYRKAMYPEHALQQLKEGAGTQFWPPAVEAMLRINRQTSSLDDIWIAMRNK
ncbi:HD domain-containing protein [Paenibacillus taihuensis]|uniref:HD domain-containing protein n=1 Tax=Paenibacillus taihuensis TaxID=1156355 RepID=A0A3D9QUK7_9BACL|nr:HD-GYP domain-containing protein [Paenibacillus taihuensis]REE67308.1 HD domain-containing protein [Paenibacillus taihuensis]